MTENTISIRLGIGNEKTRKDLEEIISAEEGFRLLRRHDDPCDLLILETENDTGEDFQLIQDLQASGKVKGVFLTSSRFEPDLLLQALRAGVIEFISQPIKKEDVRSGLLKFRERRGVLQQKDTERKKGKIIHFISSKGGVGTTTIAVNLAASLCESNGSSSVALIDMNLPFGQIPIFLNTKSSFNWGEVLRDISRVDETFLMGVLSKHSSGIYVLPSPATLDDVNVETPEMMEKLLSLMRNLFDFILVDGGQRLDHVSLRVLEMSDTVFMVTVLNVPCLTNAKRLLWTFQKLGFPPREAIRIIANRYQKKSSISLKEAEEAVSEKIHWLVANDYPLTMSAINQGKTISEVAHGSEVSKSLRELAETFFSNGQKKRTWT